ncbi:hypothetical protein VPHD530_0016 [Vibrio phage D530]
MTLVSLSIKMVTKSKGLRSLTIWNRFSLDGLSP